MKTAIAATLLALLAWSATATADPAAEPGPCPPIHVMTYDPYVSVHPECLEPYIPDVPRQDS